MRPSPALRRERAEPLVGTDGGRVFNLRRPTAAIGYLRCVRAPTRLIAPVLAAVAVVALAAAWIPGADGATAQRVVHFKGKSKSGQPIRFRVVTKAGRSKIKGLAVNVVTECWADLNNDGVEDKVVARIRKLSGRLSRDGVVDVYYAPDDDTEYLVEGRLKGRTAKLNVVVGGRFSADGIPNGGDLECDNWGTRYKARQRR